MATPRSLTPQSRASATCSASNALGRRCAGESRRSTLLDVAVGLALAVGFLAAAAAGDETAADEAAVEELSYTLGLETAIGGFFTRGTNFGAG